MEDLMNDPTNPELALEFTETLAATTSQGSGTMSEQDLYQSTVLLDSVSHVVPKNKTQAKSIMKVSTDCKLSFMCMTIIFLFY